MDFCKFIFEIFIVKEKVSCSARKPVTKFTATQTDIKQRAFRDLMAMWAMTQ